ncbi:ras guanine nucleotide exchange factor i-related [Anaeramoeba flamelloides]|uniref:Ras guanine nucleotide exchange factor i-related n=1 Tax=Anaeramoeba flamelloides TaxID=1746091 RepID=A0ABQ8YFQ9_9EUKA|nr:ras guanine nucleotide exchange factor i-related [Anaeramoeba flamelloides]
MTERNEEQLKKIDNKNENKTENFDNEENNQTISQTPLRKSKRPRPLPKLGRLRYSLSPQIGQRPLPLLPKIKPIPYPKNRSKSLTSLDLLNKSKFETPKKRQISKLKHQNEKETDNENENENGKGKGNVNENGKVNKDVNENENETTNEETAKRISKNSNCLTTDDPNEENTDNLKETKKTKEDTIPRIPSNLWLAKLMKDHPELLETRERILPLTKQNSFGVLYNKDKTENKERIGGKNLLQMIFQFLSKEGLKESAKLLQKESNSLFCRHYSDNNVLTTLLSLGVFNVEKIWRLNYKKLWEHLGDQEMNEVIISDRKAPLLQEEDDQSEDINIWDEPEENEANILYLDSEDKTNKILHAANLNRLIIKITHPEINDIRIMDVFLMTYQSFTSPGKLLLKLFQRYQPPENLNERLQNQTEKEIGLELRTIKLRTFHVLKKWIENHFSDFNEGLLGEVNEFIEKNINDPQEKNIMEILKKSIKNQQKGNNKEKINLQTPPEPKVPKNIFSESLTLFDIDEEEIARQISIIDFEIFSKIRPAELLNCAWSKEKLKHRAKNVLRMTKRFNTMSEWVATLIIKPERVRQRTKVLTKFINIAHHLRNLKNFNSLISVLSGINSSAVHRLSFTFEELKPRLTETYEKLKTLTSGKDNYKNYREVLKKSELPCIPFLGFYQTDLTFIEDGNPDYIDGLINFSKRSLVYDIIFDIQSYQVKSYNLHPVYQIALFLNKFPRMDKKTLYQMSLKREPRKADRNDIKF